MTTVLDRVRKFVERLAPEPVCDDCIAEKLELTIRQNAGHLTNELAGTDHFARDHAPCALCGAPKTVIRKAR